MNVLRAQYRLHRLQSEPIAVQLGRVHLHPYPGPGSAAHRHLAHALQLRKLLRNHRRTVVVKRRLVVLVRRQSQNHDRRIRRIYLAIGRIGRQVRRQVRPGRIDGRLHIARRAVNIPAQVKLQGNARAAQRALRRHFGHAGNVT